MSRYDATTHASASRNIQIDAELLDLLDELQITINQIPASVLGVSTDTVREVFQSYHDSALAYVQNLPDQIADQADEEGWPVSRVFILSYLAEAYDGYIDPRWYKVTMNALIEMTVQALRLRLNDYDSQKGYYFRELLREFELAVGIDLKQADLGAWLKKIDEINKGENPEFNEIVADSIIEEIENQLSNLFTEQFVDALIENQLDLLMSLFVGDTCDLSKLPRSVLERIWQNLPRSEKQKLYDQVRQDAENAAKNVLIGGAVVAAVAAIAAGAGLTAAVASAVEGIKGAIAANGLQFALRAGAAAVVGAAVAASPEGADACPKWRPDRKREKREKEEPGTKKGQPKTDLQQVTEALRKVAQRLGIEVDRLLRADFGDFVEAMKKKLGRGDFTWEELLELAEEFLEGRR